jgi:hypothetical protein
MEQVLFPVVHQRAATLGMFVIRETPGQPAGLPLTVIEGPKSMAEQACAMLAEVRPRHGRPGHRLVRVRLADPQAARFDGNSYELALALADRLISESREPGFRIFATGEIPSGKGGLVDPVKADAMEAKVAIVTAAADDGDVFLLPAANYRDLTPAARSMLGSRPGLRVRAVRHFEDLADLWT